GWPRRPPRGASHPEEHDVTAAENIPWTGRGYGKVAELTPGRGEPRPAYWGLLLTTPPGGPDGPHPRGRGLPGRARPAGGDARGRRAPRALRARRSRGPPAPDGRRRDPGPGPGPGRRRRPGAGGAGPDAPARGRLRTAGGAAAPQPGAGAGALGEGRGVHEGRSAAPGGRRLRDQALRPRRAHRPHRGAAAPRRTGRDGVGTAGARAARAGSGPRPRFPRRRPGLAHGDRAAPAAAA